MSERGVRVAGNDNKRDIGIEGFRELDKLNYFPSLSGVAEKQQHVVALEDTEVAVLSFRRMKEYGGSSGRTESRGDIHCYLPGFPHTRSNEFTPLSVHFFHYKIHRIGIILGNRDFADGFRLGIQY